MGSLFLTALLGAVGVLANKEPCSSGQFTTTGECCRQCQPGEGVIKTCAATQTVCAPCLDSETFSESFSHTETCQPCTRCTHDLLRMRTPCTDSNDATCACNYGYYLNQLTGQCERCTRCMEGQGMLYTCDHDHDTVCEECSGETYSDQESSMEPCMFCTLCDEEEVTLQDCSPVRDTVCEGTRHFPYASPSPSPGSSLPSFTDDDVFPEAPMESASTTTTTTTANSTSTTTTPTASTTTPSPPDSPKLIYQGLNENLIPIYCSILATVVVGLVAFIIVKRWNSCKQNKQGAQNCTASQNQTPSPEGEKLHSDSGISVDSQSLQEQQGGGLTQAQTVVTVDEEPVCLLLPLHTREEVEKLLSRGGGGEEAGPGYTQDSDWCSLAGLLGYEQERIATFRRDEHPVRALLSDWASRDCASVDTLCTALRQMNRDDIARSLTLDPAGTAATSAV